MSDKYYKGKITTKKVMNRLMDTSDNNTSNITPTNNLDTYSYFNHDNGGFLKYMQQQQQSQVSNGYKLPTKYIGDYMKNGILYHADGSKVNTSTSTEPVSNTSNSFDISKGLIKSPLSGNSITTHNGTFIPVDNDVTSEQVTKTFGSNAKLIKLGNQQYIQQDPTFMQKYGQGIQLGLGTAQLGLGIGNFLENRATAKKQRALLSEQLKEAKEEYSRIKQTRAKLNASY